MAAVSDHEFRCIRGMVDHSFLIFRDLDMTAEQHIAFTRRLGPLHQMTPLRYCWPDHPEILCLPNQMADGKQKGIRRAGMGWHTDGEDKAIPNAGAFLYAMRIPEEGGTRCSPTCTRLVAPCPTECGNAWRDGVHLQPDRDAQECTRLEPDLHGKRRARTSGRAPSDHSHHFRAAEGRRSISVDGRATSRQCRTRRASARAGTARVASQPQFVYRHNGGCMMGCCAEDRCTLHCATPFDETRYIRYISAPRWRACTRV